MKSFNPITYALEQLGVNQKELAKQLSVSPSMISQIKNNPSMLPIEIEAELCSLCGLFGDHLYFASRVKTEANAHAWASILEKANGQIESSFDHSEESGSFNDYLDYELSTVSYYLGILFQYFEKHYKPFAYEDIQAIYDENEDFRVFREAMRCWHKYETKRNDLAYEMIGSDNYSQLPEKMRGSLDMLIDASGELAVLEIMELGALEKLESIRKKKGLVVSRVLSYLITLNDQMKEKRIIIKSSVFDFLSDEDLRLVSISPKPRMWFEELTTSAKEVSHYPGFEADMNYIKSVCESQTKLIKIMSMQLASQEEMLGKLLKQQGKNKK